MSYIGHLWWFKVSLLAPKDYNILLGPNSWVCSPNHIQVLEACTQCSKNHNVDYHHLKTKDTMEMYFMVGQQVIDGPRCLEDSFRT